MAQNDSGIDATRDAEELLNLDQGDVVILDGHEGQYTLLRKERTNAGTVVGWRVLDEGLTVHQIRYFDAAGAFLQFIPNEDVKPVYDVENQHRAEDFHVVDHDRQAIEAYLQLLRRGMLDE